MPDLIVLCEACKDKWAEEIDASCQEVGTEDTPITMRMVEIALKKGSDG